MSKERETSYRYTNWAPFQGELGINVLLLLKRNKEKQYFIFANSCIQIKWFFDYFRIKIFLTFLLICLVLINWSKIWLLIQNAWLLRFPPFAFTQVKCVVEVNYTVGLMEQELWPEDEQMASVVFHSEPVSSKVARWWP